MRTRFRDIAFFPLALACIELLEARGIAQTFRALHSFAATAANGTNSEGANPNGSLLLSGGTLYGTALNGGALGNGAVFAMKVDGTAFTNLYSFSATSGSFLSATNGDGANPTAGLALSGATLYGTANRGGPSGDGTVFKVNTDGSGFACLHVFDYTLGFHQNGASPGAALLLASSTLYGTTDAGGDQDNGTVFKVHTDGSSFATVFSFWFARNWHWPHCALVSSDHTLYGASAGGSGNDGTVFKVKEDGSDFMVLHSFTGDADGADPTGGLVLSGSTLYGAVKPAMGIGAGTLFSVQTDGSSFSVLYRFTGGSDGSAPQGLLLSGNTLYGTTRSGGKSNKGTVFAVNTDGTGFETLYAFTGGNDGSYPRAGLVLFESTLYGTTASGGHAGNGTVFSILLPGARPRISVRALGNNLVFNWPAQFTGFTLQFADSLEPSVVWRPVDLQAPPTVLDGQNVLTLSNAMSLSHRFYRLCQ